MSEQTAMSTANADAAAARYVARLFSLRTATHPRGTSGVLATLITFSVSLGVIPIGAYFLSLYYFWAGESRLTVYRAR